MWLRTFHVVCLAFFVTAAFPQSNHHVQLPPSSRRSIARSNEGTLTVTARVVSSVGVIIRPDGRQQIFVANAPDQRESLSAQENAVRLAFQASEAASVTARFLLRPAASTVRSVRSATELQTVPQVVCHSGDEWNQAGVLPERSSRSAPPLPSEGKPDADPVRK